MLTLREGPSGPFPCEGLLPTRQPSALQRGEWVRCFVLVWPITSPNIILSLSLSVTAGVQPCSSVKPVWNGIMATLCNARSPSQEEPSNESLSSLICHRSAGGWEEVRSLPFYKGKPERDRSTNSIWPGRSIHPQTSCQLPILLRVFGDWCRRNKFAQGMYFPVTSEMKRDHKTSGGEVSQTRNRPVHTGNHTPSYLLLWVLRGSNKQAVLIGEI